LTGDEPVVSQTNKPVVRDKKTLKPLPSWWGKPVVLETIQTAVKSLTNIKTNFCLMGGGDEPLVSQTIQSGDHETIKH
jgi:hypothetical protein